MGGHIIEALIPISLFLVTGAIIITTLVLRLQKRKVESQEILAAIEKGVDVKFPEQAEKNRLLPGLVWTLVGIVATLAMFAMSPQEIHRGVWIWGLVPVAVGIANLIVYKMENQQEKNTID
ncbi:hypothetical protein HQ531_13100 [bacterium]|nr:hypothetical protein [bacterium]